ncbi:MAG TPA: M23 family metallopeptidase [Sunxiuqinia sp.]|nr:M23 family metallopeptidase [Sunxiuqinia sp.]
MKFRFLIYFTFIFNLAFAQVNDQQYFQPPVKIPIVLSGNFGELRPNHFHSGIDIRTNGKIGLPIYAAADGYISRIKVSPWGFGHAIYINHPNGTTTVYGHLSLFRKDIAEYVKDRQYKGESFAVDFAVPTDKFKVKQGEQIAWSGNSGGSAGPHLHFEIRNTKSEHPLNPLQFHLPVSDDIKPKVLSVMVYPLSDDAHVYGKPEKRLFETVFYGSSYHIKRDPTILVYGKVGFGIQTLDYLDGSWSKCGVYQIKLSVDGKPVYTFRMDELSFAQTRYVNSQMDYGYYRQHYKKIQRSWVQPGNKLDNYHNLVNRGIVDLSDGKRHAIHYEIKDVYGNTSTLDFRVQSKKEKVTPIAKVGQLIPWNEASDFDGGDLKAHFDDGTFYSSFNMDFKKKSSNNLYSSPLYELENDETPVQKFYTLKIKADQVPIDLWNKALIATVSEKSGHKWSMGGKYKDGWIVAKVRQLGTFAISVDTIAPTIRPLSIYGHSRLREQNRIRFKIEDDFSGIDRYRGEIDGKWVLFEYNPKYDMITYHIDGDRLKLGKNHNLVLTVVDNKGNVAKYEATFYR